MAASKKSPPRGLGTVPYTGVTIFPTVARVFWDGEPLDSHATTMVTVMQVLRDHRISGAMNMCKMSETLDQPNIQVEFLDAIAHRPPFNSCMSTERVFRDGLPGSSPRTLAVLRMSMGIASEGSKVNGYMHSRNKSAPCVSSVFEVKNDCDAPKEGNLEAICSATNIALGLVRRNISPDNVVVPIFSTNGRLGQVLAVSFLPRSTFPIVSIVTTVFDLFHDQGLLLAASGLCKMVEYNSSVQNLCNDQPISQVLDMELDLEMYHLKSVNEFFQVMDGENRDKSIVRFFEMTRVLGSHDFACCPLAYRLGDTATEYQEDAIVFENLHRQGYCIGLPRESPSERQELVNAIKAAVLQFHALGLVHMDLYLSNIMWRKDSDGKYCVKIVDFDSIHRDGERFSTRMVDRLNELGFDESWINNGAHRKFDECYLRHIEQHMNESQLMHQEDQVATKRTLDAFFRHTFEASSALSSE